MLILCLIGCGGMATHGHGPAFQKYAAENSQVYLAGCCDVDAVKAEEFRKRFGFARAYTDMDEMLRTEKPDAVSLIVPVPLTEKMSIKLLEMGIPTILEKPPGMNREQTLRMMDVAARTGTIHQVAFNRRYMPMIRRFKELSKACNPHLWQYDFYRCGRKDADFSTTSIHAIDTVRYLAGKDYKSVKFEYIPNPAGEEFVPSILLDATFDDGQKARITFVPGSGSILYTKNHELVVHETAVESEEDFISNGFYGENVNFLECVAKGIHPVDDIASGLQAVEIADCIRKREISYKK